MPFAPMAVGTLPTATGSRTSVAIDATSNPGVELLATFVPAVAVLEGVRRVAATQIVTANVSIAFDSVLPLSWLASALRRGDVAANLLAQPYATVADQFQLSFGDLVVAHGSGGWQLPHYDGSRYSVNVGFGIGLGGFAWGYSVQCQPGQSIVLAPGSYQLVRSDGQAGVGDPIGDALELWAMPPGFDYALIFDQCGYGVLSTLDP